MTEQLPESQPQPPETLDSLEQRWRVANIKWLAITNLGENVDTPEAVAWAQEADRLGKEVSRMRDAGHHEISQDA